MSQTTTTERKWQQQWHDGIIDALDSMLRGFGKELTVECNRGKSPGADMVVHTRRTPAQIINVEVQMHPSGKGFTQSMDRWAQRHTRADATFIVCPMALLPTLARRVESHRVLGRADGIYIFGDTPEHLTLLCACVFTFLRAST